MSMKICLLSITASHYRSRIYAEMDRQMDCDFIFGKDNTTVKRMDTSILKNSIDLPNKRIGGTRWYTQPGVLGKVKNYDVIINDLGIYCISSWIFTLLSKFKKQKVYIWDHGYYGKESMIRTWIKRIYFGLADGSFIYGDYAIRLMKEKGFNGKKLYPIHNSLDYQSQLELRSKIQKSDIFKKHFGNNAPVLLFIGRLNPVKQLDMILEAVNILKEKNLSYNIVFVGDGPEREKLESKANELKLRNKIWFYGACYDEKKNAELIYNADLCVAPGNIGLTAMHSLVFGTPALTHNDFKWQMPEFEAIKEYHTGLFFERNNINSLADKIEEWFRLNGLDRERIRNLCYKEIDENWTPEYQINVLKKVIYG